MKKINNFKLIIIIFLIIINNFKIINCLNNNDIIINNINNATCNNYIGDQKDKEICKNKLLNLNNIYTLNNNQEISLKSVEFIFAQLTFLQSKCNNLNFAQFGFCEIYFPSCKNVITNESSVVSLPQRLCKSVCLKMVSDCPILASNLNCSDPLKFPEYGTTYNLTSYGFKNDNDGTGLYFAECIDITSFYNNQTLINNNGIAPVNQMVEVCPFPLLLKNQSDPNFDSRNGYTYLTPTNCVLSCPQPIYTNKKWQQMREMSKIVSCLGFICSIYNVVTFGLLGKNKSKYNLCLTFFSTSVVFMALADIITFSVGYDKTLCPEPGRYAVQDDKLCGFTGAIFHLGISNGVLWWTTMAIYLWSVVKRVTLCKFRYFIIFNCVASVISTIIPLSGKAFMAGTASLGCWIRKEWYVNGPFWIPFAICMFVGVTCLISVIYELFKLSRSIRKDNSAIFVQIRPALCVLFVGGSFFYLFIFYFNNERHQDEYRASISNYVQCLLLNYNDKNANCSTDGPNFGAYFMFYFFIRLFGVTAFCIYGTSKIARDIWIDSNLLNHPITKPYVNKILNLLGISIRSNKSSSGSGIQRPSFINRNESNFNLKKKNTSKNNNLDIESQISKQEEKEKEESTHSQQVEQNEKVIESPTEEKEEEDINKEKETTTTM